MGVGGKKLKRQLKSAAEKGIERHRRTSAQYQKLDNLRVNMYYTQVEAADALERRRLLAEEAASSAQAVMGPEQDEDAEMAEEGESSALANDKEFKKELKKNAKVNRFRFKTFPKIVDIALPNGFSDNYKDPGQGNFFPLWEPEVVVSLRAALGFAQAMQKNGARLQSFVYNLFEAAVQVKEKNPAMFPIGRLVLPADQEAFLGLVEQKMSLYIQAGSMGQIGRNLSPYCLGLVIDGVAKARRAYVDNSIPARPREP